MSYTKPLSFVLFAAILLKTINFANYSRLETTAIILLSLIFYKIVNTLFNLVYTCYLANYLGLGVKWRCGHKVWAIITGATDGIGLEYAKQLAAKGYSLLIISRSEDKLRTVAKQISSQYPQCKQVKVIAADFNRTDIYDNISAVINSLEDIDVLVNNVGTLYEKGCEYFTEIPNSYNEAYLNVNMRSYVKLIEIVLPIMVRQKRGIIINISSIAGVIPNPLMTGYSASKAFDSFLSQSLSIEYESKGVIIQTVHPGQVVTNMSRSMTKSYFTVDADQYVSQALQTVGIEWSTYGHWKHKLIVIIMTFMISIFGERSVSKMFFGILRKYRTTYYEQNNMKMSFY